MTASGPPLIHRLARNDKHCHPGFILMLRAISISWLPVRPQGRHSFREDTMLMQETIRKFAFAAGIALVTPAVLHTPASAADVTPAEARAIAKEAYIYGFPMVDDVAGVKVASEQETTTTDPDAVDRAVSAREADATYRGNVALRLRSIGPRVVRSATCLYTTSPDSGFVFDRHAEHDAIWIVSACSGHAFKHSAGLGEAIADRVLGRPGFDLSVFASRRFDAAA